MMMQTEVPLGLGALLVGGDGGLSEAEEVVFVESEKKALGAFGAGRNRRSEGRCGGEAHAGGFFGADFC